MENSTNNIWDFNIDFSVTDKVKRKKVSKITENLNKQLTNILSDIHRTLQSITAEYIFYTSTHKLIMRIDHKLSSKSSFNKFQRTDIIWYRFSDNSEV